MIVVVLTGALDAGNKKKAQMYAHYTSSHERLRISCSWGGRDGIYMGYIGMCGTNTWWKTALGQDFVAKWPRLSHLLFTLAFDIFIWKSNHTSNHIIYLMIKSVYLNFSFVQCTRNNLCVAFSRAKMAKKFPFVLAVIFCRTKTNNYTNSPFVIKFPYFERHGTSVCLLVVLVSWLEYNSRWIMIKITIFKSKICFERKNRPFLVLQGYKPFKQMWAVWNFPFPLLDGKDEGERRKLKRNHHEAMCFHNEERGSYHRLKFQSPFFLFFFFLPFHRFRVNYRKKQVKYALLKFISGHIDTASDLGQHRHPLCNSCPLQFLRHAC